MGQIILSSSIILLYLTSQVEPSLLSLSSSVILTLSFQILIITNKRRSQVKNESGDRNNTGNGPEGTSKIIR
jgi:hypothetical protein